MYVYMYECEVFSFKVFMEYIARHESAISNDSLVF